MPLEGRWGTTHATTTPPRPRDYHHTYRRHSLVLFPPAILISTLSSAGICGYGDFLHFRRSCTGV